MKAWLSIEPGGPERLAFNEVARPVPADGELLISVQACGLNFPDGLFLRDLYQVKLPRPFTPGAEVSGVVAAVGGGVSGFAVGDAVVALCGQGGLAEAVAVRADRCFRLPGGLTAHDAAGFLFTYATAHYALRRRASLAPQERVLVLGAGGGVGLAAVELATALGAQVFAAASSEDKLAQARARGARDGLLYPRELRTDEDARALAGALKRLLGEAGADVVVDPVGGPYAEPALRAIGWEGRYLVIGFTAGIPRVPLNLPLLKGCQIVGVDWRQFMLRDPPGFAAATAELLEMAARGQVRPRAAEVFPFEAAREALARLEGRAATGKVVVDVSGPAPVGRR
ncbi:MAG TPA: NADPH:quinone oxidoreductase family protein [Phenylobacterium sp.]|nr:NADPH:quinone oxidoreductase family protein [Phenylobacterium sp.]